MKPQTKYNIILLGFLLVAILFLYLKSQTVKEGNLMDDSRKLSAWLDKFKTFAESAF